MSSSSDKKKRSTPPERAEPLPESFPKPVQDDPEALSRVQALLQSSAYVRADRDSAFLNRDELRHARLELEYLKTELTLKHHLIERTIVLFGGTRVVEPAQAARQLAELKAHSESAPESVDLNRRINTAQRILQNSKYYDVARAFARLVSTENLKRSPQERLIIATGGGPGIMEAGNRGAYDAGCPSIGMNITLPMEQFPNPYITPELCFQFRYFALRKFHFIQRARALVAFPGGYGTFDELFDALCLVQTRKIKPIPIVLVNEKFWRRAFDAEFLAAEGVIAPEDVELFSYAESAGEIWENINIFWENGHSSLPQLP